MTRICDNCKKPIPTGQDHIEVKFIGINEMEEMFGDWILHFCKFECLVMFWDAKE